MRRNSISILAFLAFAVLTAGCTQQADIGITTKVKSFLESDRSVTNAAQIQVTTENKVVTLAGAVDTPATKRHAVTLARSVDGVKKVVDNLTVAPGSVAVAEAQPVVAPGSVAEAQPAVAPAPVAEKQPAVAPVPVAKAKPEVAPAPVAKAKPAVAPAPVAETQPALAPVPVAEVQPALAPVPVAEAQPAMEAAPATVTAPTDASITQAVKEKLLLQPETSTESIAVETHEGVVTLSGTVKSPQARDQVIQIARNTQGVQGVQDKLTVISS